MGVDLGKPLSEVITWYPIEQMGTQEKYSGGFLLWSFEFVDLDFRPTGVMEGYWQDGEGWTAAGWDDNNDVFTTVVVQPTHYAAVPNALVRACDMIEETE